MIDLGAQYRSLKAPIDAAIAEVLASGQFTLGPQMTALEQELANHLKVKHAITLNSGTDALVLTLRACDIGPGAEVIVPTFTFFATAEAVRLVGARPVFVDCALGSFNLDSESVEQAITPNTQAVIAVHLYGEPAPMAPLVELCRAQGLHLIEDAAQAFGAIYRGKSVGGLGLAGAFSFYPTKNLGAYGDGGALVTDDDAIATKVKCLRDHGRVGNGFHSLIGYNSRLDEFQAAILRIKLAYVDGWNEARRILAAAYRERLSGTRCEFSATNPDGTHVYHQFVVAHPQRDFIRKALSSAGISTGVYYPVPCHLQPAFADLGTPASLPVAERWATTSIALPIYAELPMPVLDSICEAIRSAECDL